MDLQQDDVRLLSGEVDSNLQPIEGIDLRQHWHTLRKRRFAVILTALVVVACAIAGTLLMRPIFQSVVTLQIERENPNILTFQEVQVIDARQDDFFSTHHLLLQSRGVMRRVAEDLRLDQHPMFAPGLQQIDDQRLRQNSLVATLQGMTTVLPVRRSRLVEIQVESQEPELSSRIANALAQAYIDINLESKFEATEAATEFLSNQIDGLKIELEDGRKALQDYAKENRILSLDDRQNITVQRLEDLNSALTRAQTERMEREAGYKSLLGVLGAGPQESDLASRIEPPVGLELWRVPEVANNQLMQTLRASHATLNARYVELGERFAPDWPEMVRVRQKLKALESQIKSEEWRIVAGLLKRAESEYRASQARERMLAAKLEEQKDSVSELNRSAINYNSLKAEVDTKDALLASLLKRKSETDVSARLKGLKSSNVRVVDQAQAATSPSRPNKRTNAMLGLLIGLALGIGVAFFLEYIDNTIKSVEDVERHTGLPSFGVIPLFAQEEAERRALSDGKEGEASTSLVTLREARSPVSEAYRAVRTSLLLSSAGSPPRTMLVTSSQPGEGKTTTVVNTAIALAQAGRQVLLIDSDLRRPRCHKLLGLHNRSGLSTFLAGSHPLKSLVQVTSVRNLFVLTSGPVPPNPSELLGSDRMAELLKAVPPGIQHILLDSPPVLSVTDPSLVARLVDGVILVVRAGTTPWPLLKRTHRRLRDISANVIGVILNSLDAKSGDYYAYSYSYGYGEDTKAEPDKS